MLKLPYVPPVPACATKAMLAPASVAVSAPETVCAALLSVIAFASLEIAVATSVTLIVTAWMLKAPEASSAFTLKAYVLFVS